MKNSIRIAVILFSLLTSCKKQSSKPVPYIPDGPSASLNDYVKIDPPGNYWNYEVFLVDSGGNASVLGHDSAFISGDSLITGTTYKYVPAYLFLSITGLLRDSAGILVNNHSDLFLKVNGLPDTLSIKNTTDFDSYTYCENYPGSITVTGGIFNRIIKTTIDYYVKAPLDTTHNPVRYELFFAKGVGLIKENFAYYSQAVVGMHNERILTGFYVQ